MSIQRAMIILFKDLNWAIKNSKLLMLMVMPIFIMVLFSKLDSSGTFGYSISFINAFVGIFSTSYLITEEKSRGTLVALLTTPLRGSELLLGKFLFNLLLCLAFTVMSIVVNNRFDLFLRPFAILNCFLFAGTTCFFGYTLGVFFRSEKEMSVLAPFLLIFFAMGETLENLSTQVPIGGFFPSYHLTQSLREVPLATSALLMHSMFSMLQFAVTFFMAMTYTHFYFSNHRDGKRFSKSLVFSFLGFFVLLFISGLYTMKSTVPETLNDKTKKVFTMTTEKWDVEFHYDEKKFFVKELIDTGKRKAYFVKEVGNEKLQVILAIRELDDGEASFEKRGARMRGNYKKLVVAEENSSKFEYPARNWVYLYKGDQTVLQEVICDREVFQWGIDQDLKKMKDYEKSYKTFLKLSKNLKIKCKGNVQAE